MNANTLHYTNELQSLKKRGISMNDYLLKFKNLVDMLSYAGQCITEQNQILQILSGLGAEYDPIMMTVTAQLGSYSVDEISSLLLTVEKNLEQQSLSSNTLAINFTSGNARGAGNYHGGNHNNQRFSNSSGSYFNNRGGFHGNGRTSQYYRGGRNGGRGGRSYNFSKPQCQLYW